MNRRNLLITSALKQESQPIKNGIDILHYKNLNIDYFTSGIGKEKSSKRIFDKINNSDIDFILNIGAVGNLNDDLKIKDIVFPSKFIAIENDSLNIIDIDPIFINNYDNAKWCKIFTSQKPVTNKPDKDNILQNTGACIVDMESFWIAQICNKNKINFLSIKVVSDYAENLSMSDFKKELYTNAESLVEPIKKILEVYNQ